jgi:hypothetical protein
MAGSVDDASRAPKELFKGVPEQHLDGLLRRGCVRVGTLADFRGQEFSTRGVHDPRDATRLVVVDSYRAPTAKASELPEPMGVIAESMVGPLARATYAFQDCSFDQAHPDAYVYCTFQTIAAAKEMFSVGVRITNPYFFVRAIHRRLAALDLIDGPVDLGPCSYVSDSQDFREMSDVPLAFQKLSEFSPQAEFRFVWRPRGAPKPLTLEVPELREFVEPW